MSKFEKLLHSELLNFADRLEDMLDDHNISTDDLTYVRFYIVNMTPYQAMQHVIEQILPWKKQIELHDETFFYRNKRIFGKLPDNKVNYFSDVLTKTFNQEDKNEVWQFFDAFVAMAEEYKKNK